MICSICKRDTPDRYIEDHHLKLKSKHGKEKILVCCDCGDQIHKLFTNKELVKLDTLDKLLVQEKVWNWVKWIRNKNTFGFCMKSKKRR